CGSPTIRDPLGNRIELRLFPSLRTLIPSRLTNSSAFNRNSPLGRKHGLSSRIRLPGTEIARCTALTAITVDFPPLPATEHDPSLPAAQRPCLLLVGLEPQPLLCKRNRIHSLTRWFFADEPHPRHLCMPYYRTYPTHSPPRLVPHLFPHWRIEINP